MQIKPIGGTWFEFQHHSKVEGTYWNDACAAFSAREWREKLREIWETGMEHLVLLATALDFTAYFETDIYPPSRIACPCPMEVLLEEADTLGMKVFVSTGFYGEWTQTEKNMTDPQILSRMLRAMDQLAERYGSHQSFYGWYYPDECWINGHIPEHFIKYVNLASGEAHRLNPHFRTMIGPYGTKDIIADDRYIQDLERLDVDIMAYQDEVGVCKSTVEDTPRYYEALRRAHDKAGRAALWADVEVFTFEREVYRSPLLPAPFERVKKQLEAVSPYTDQILIYEYQGMMNKPGSGAFAGHPSSTKLYEDYMAWKKAFAEPGV